MFEADAFSVLARSVVTVVHRPSGWPAWNEATVGLAAGVLQRAFRLDEDARDASSNSPAARSGCGRRNAGGVAEATPFGQTK